MSVPEANAPSQSWTTLLQNYISKGKQKPMKEQEEETTQLFMDILDEDAKKNEEENSEIPRFFFKKPTNFSDIYLSVKTEAKQKFLILKSYDLPQKKNLRELWGLLKENISPPNDSTERINYRDFRKVAEKSPLFSEYFKASTFLKFDKDKFGRIEILSFFHYIVRKNNIEENKISLSLSDVCCEGFLIDKDLENYIKKEIRQFPFYDEINDDIKEYYLLVAVRKFFFFLDPKRTGKIYINDIVTSSILPEFLEMSDRSAVNNQLDVSSNWFSIQNFWRIYKKYVELDRDRNGMLSKEELIKFGPGLTSIFIDRIFEEYQKYENAIDFKQFIDFVLAMENRKEPASIQFIWRAIDVYHKNAVDTFVINMFYRAVVKKLINRDKGEYRIDDIKDEIWDMIKPKNPNYITLEDVLKSSYRDLVLSLLIDAKAFYQHDQKEYQYIDEFVELDEDYN
jgi:serine/threonine-protein phosphatase 2A regulatory subunit B''